ncbi:MAG: acetate kinase [Paraperlucidibaca sp.]
MSPTEHHATSAATLTNITPEASAVLVINAGSSSIKFALIDVDSPTPILRGEIDRLGSPEAALNWRIGADKQTELALPNASHRNGFAAIVNCLVPYQRAVKAIGHRVVHGGESVQHAARIDAACLATLEANSALAPLHNPANIAGINAAMAAWPTLPHIAVCDTAFHQTLPEMAYRYAIPEALYREHGVRRYGFHGTSHCYVSAHAAEAAGLSYQNSAWLVAHLGNGVSTCAVLNGESVDTSMGLTPLEGAVMGTRSGDVDPNLHGHLQRSLGWSLERIDTLLNRESGLLGLSGLSNDMRTLLEARAEGHEAAHLAIAVFCYRLAKSLAAMRCALPRLDGLIFTGGIGEHAPAIRRETLAHLSWLGTVLDDSLNDATVGRLGRISQPSGEVERPAIWVIPTNEERQIARETLAVLLATSAT